MHSEIYVVAEFDYVNMKNLNVCLKILMKT